MKEKVRAVVDLELVFCKDHNLLIYPKSIMAKQQSKRIIEEDVKESNSSEDKSSEDELSNIEKKQDF